MVKPLDHVGQVNNRGVTGKVTGRVHALQPSVPSARGPRGRTAHAPLRRGPQDLLWPLPRQSVHEEDFPAPVPPSMPMTRSDRSARSDVTSMSSRIRSSMRLQSGAAASRSGRAPRQPRNHCALRQLPRGGERTQACQSLVLPRFEPRPRRARRPLPASRQPVVQRTRACVAERTVRSPNRIRGSSATAEGTSDTRPSHPAVIANADHERASQR